MNIIRRLTQHQFQTFVENYYHYKSDWAHPRLGQEFLNRFFNDVVDPDLFYMEDDVLAIERILQEYVELKEERKVA